MVRFNRSRLFLGTFALISVYGPESEVLSYVDNDLNNKQTIVAAGAHKDDGLAMVLHIEETSSVDLDIARKSIPAQIINAVLSGHGEGWSFFSKISAMQDKTDVVVGGLLLATKKKIQIFASRLAKKIFAKDSTVSGTIDGTRTLLLIAPDAERYVLAWNYDNIDETLTILTQPFSVDSKTVIRYTAADSTLLASYSGSGQIKMVEISDLTKAIKQGNYSWKNAIDLGDNVEIRDFSVGQKVNDVLSIAVTGIYDGKLGVQMLTVLKKDGQITIEKSGAPTEFGVELSSFGSIVRFGPETTIFVNHDGVDNKVTNIPTNLLPTNVKSALLGTQAAQA